MIYNFLYFQEGVTVYKPSKVRVRSLYDKEFKDDVDRFHRFHGSLIHQIEVGCATARIPIYPSYYKLKGKVISFHLFLLLFIIIIYIAV